VADFYSVKDECIQVYVYCSTPRRDSKSLHLRNSAEAAGCVWRLVESLPSTQLASLIRADLVDVLIELTGMLPSGSHLLLPNH
jgi:predicted O-linked N-acetylglucosamine transferase (SPINDLY family)